MGFQSSFNNLMNNAMKSAGLYKFIGMNAQLQQGKEDREHTHNILTQGLLPSDNAANQAAASASNAINSKMTTKYAMDSERFRHQTNRILPQIYGLSPKESNDLWFNYIYPPKFTSYYKSGSEGTLPINEYIQHLSDTQRDKLIDDIKSINPDFEYDPDDPYPTTDFESESEISLQKDPSATYIIPSERKHAK